MMMTESSIYWITRLDYFKGLAVGLVFFGLTAFTWTGAFLVFNITELTKDKKHIFYKAMSFSALIAAIGSLGIVFIPTTKEMAMIKVIPALTNSELVQKTIPAEAKEIYALAKYALTKTIKEEK